MYASSNGHTSTVEMLLDRGAEIHHTTTVDAGVGDVPVSVSAGLTETERYFSMCNRMGKRP